MTILPLCENLGYAEGNNMGMRYALEQGADYVLLLNNDTVVDARLLDRLIEVAEAERSIGIVSPKIMLYAEPQRIWCAGAKIDWASGQTFRLREGEHDSGTNEDTPVDVGSVSGCALCVKREAVERIGMLDARYFMYYEETDWCVRAREAGYRIVYVPQGRIWHKVGASSGGTPISAYYMNRNVFLFLSKAVPWPGVMRPMFWQIRHQMRAVMALTVKAEYRGRQVERELRRRALVDALLGTYGKASLGT